MKGCQVTRLPLNHVTFPINPFMPEYIYAFVILFVFAFKPVLNEVETVNLSGANTTLYN